MRLSRRYRVAAVDSKVRGDVIRCIVKKVADIGLSMLSKPPEAIVPRKNRPVTIQAISSMALSLAVRFIWKMVMTKKTAAAIETSL